MNSGLINGLEKSVIDWTRTVQSNGGGTPSGNTNRAMSNFYKQLRVTGLINKIKALNTIVPDSLIAAQTPLIKSNGNAVWTNNNFVSGDLTINGLAGDGSTKYLNTGINPSTMISSTSNVGCTIYFPDYVTPGGHMWGITTDGYNTDFVGTTNFGGGVHFDCFDTGAGRLIIGTSYFNGFLSFSRLSDTDVRCYYRETGVSVTELGSLASSGGTCPNDPNMCVFASWNTFDANFFASSQLSFISWHDGLSLEETTLFCSLIETLRRQLGGGYVAT